MKLVRTFSLQNLKEVLYAQQGSWLYRQTDSLSARFSDLSARVLDNGLSLNQRTAADSRTTRMRITVNSGATQDPAGKQGTAHMVEHMVFRSPAVKEAIDQFEAAGGYFTATTRHDKTVYKLSIKKGWKNERMIHDLAASLLFQPEFTANDLEREKTVVINEIQSCRDKFLMHPQAESQKQAFGDDIAESVSGSVESVSKLTTDDLAAFHRKHYVPANVKIEISGISLFSDLLNHVKRSFGGIPGRPLPEKNPEKLSYAGGYRHMGDFGGKVSQTHIAASFLLPEIRSDSEFAASKVLLDYLQTSLRRKFKDGEKRYIYDFMVIPDSQSGLITLYTDISPDDAGIVLPAISEILSDIAAGEIDNDMFEIAVQQSKKYLADFNTHIKSDLEKTTTAFEDLWNYHKMNHLYGGTRPQDLQNLMRGMLSRQPTLVTMGDARNVQSFDDFKSMLPQRAAQTTLSLKTADADMPAGIPAVS